MPNVTIEIPRDTMRKLRDMTKKLESLAAGEFDQLPRKVNLMFLAPLDDSGELFHLAEIQLNPTTTVVNYARDAMTFVVPVSTDVLNFNSLNVLIVRKTDDGQFVPVARDELRAHVNAQHDRRGRAGRTA